MWFFEDFKFAYKTTKFYAKWCAQLCTKARTSISRKISCVKSGFQILYAVEQFRQIKARSTHTLNPWSAFPAHVMKELPCGSQPTAPTCCVELALKGLASGGKGLLYMGFPRSLTDGYAMLMSPKPLEENRCPWLPLPAWYGCVHAWGNGQAVGCCMCAPCFTLVVTHDPPSLHMLW